MLFKFEVTMTALKENIRGACNIIDIACPDISKQYLTYGLVSIYKHVALFYYLV